MTGPGYWVHLHLEGERLGGGFLLTRRFVLTAAHCLPGLAVDDRVGIECADGQRAQGFVRQQDKEADLALVEVTARHRVTLPMPRADVARTGERWHGPYRPADDDARLSGVITADGRHRCTGGASIEALQLTTDQHLGDYSGYSGGPVEGVPDDPGAAPAVLGILMEQTPDRADGSRAANVLVAATLGEAMRRFDHLDVGHLIDVLRPPSLQERPAPPARFSGTEALLRQLDDWGERQVIDPAQVARLKLMAVERLIDRETGGGEGTA
ncbi:trypsin-like peptidase domain-containing protein [Streptomyces longispororuber]|uniref:trypsin-like peptidase domain-containing protein n=1 Tax=Streptomyces longispororuber TaxID=68230 RepID=UPI0021087079|nr:trypsin-like peptidase domain-containing protein [Streptomyces longispororuber]MCQ4210096.1 trypsin-like serine protease [Streptomyces longispororuber]